MAGSESGLVQCGRIQNHERLVILPASHYARELESDGDQRFEPSE